MLSDAIIVTIVGAVLSIEALCGQFQFSRPLVAGTIVGLALGDIQTGVILGAEMQLIFMGLSPVGAAVPPDYLIGTVVATSFAILTGQSTEVALSMAIPIAIAGQSMNILGRTINTFIAHYADRCAEKENYNGVVFAHFLGGAVIILRTAVVIFPAIFFGVDAVNNFIAIIPEKLLNGLEVAGGLLPVVGFGLLFKMLDIKYLIPFFFIGFALSTFGKFSMIGVTMVAVCIALLYDHFRKEKVSNTVADTCSSDTELDELDALME